MFELFLVINVLFLKKIFFKEHARFDISDTNDESEFDLAQLFRVKLLCVSNLYGFAIVGYKSSKI